MKLYPVTCLYIKTYSRLLHLLHLCMKTEIMRVPVPLTEGMRVKMSHVGFEQLGHAPYSKYKIHKSGLYSVLIANCDAVNDVDILVTGEAKWMNPYGYLPGELYGKQCDQYF